MLSRINDGIEGDRVRIGPKNPMNGDPNKTAYGASFKPLGLGNIAGRQGPVIAARHHELGE